jgi:D-sedoheptulose 7-phosphate isomerase
MLTLHKHELVLALEVLDSPAGDRVLRLLREARERGRRVGLAGNGGSAATAEHLAADWQRAGGLRTVDLLGASPLLTALGNDEAFDRVFAGRLRAALDPGDLLVLISTSGRSPNLVSAAELGLSMGLRVIALTGRSNSPLGRAADVEVCVRCDGVEVVEDCHLALGHALVRALARDGGPVRAGGAPVAAALSRAGW